MLLMITLSVLTPFNKTTKMLNIQYITRHISKLNVNKAHEHGGISVRIIKICNDSISKPLYIIFKNCLTKGHFPNKWKTANAIPVHKKKERNLIQNHRPVSLLPICEQIFENILFDNLYPYIFKNNVIDDKQSGYSIGDGALLSS